MKHDINIAVPIQKWTIEKNSDGGEYVFVEGYVTTDTLDSQGEKISKAAVEKAYPDWKGNIREMHQPSAVGKAVSMDMDDKGLWVRAKVVDPSAVTKVKEGVYTAYSLGGKRISKEGDTITALKIIEASLVDVGSNPDCDFTIAKLADGKVVDVQKFEGSGDVKKLEAKFDGAVEMLGKALTAAFEKKDSDKPYGDVTYAAPGYQEDGKKRYPIDTKEHVKAAWSYINQEKNQSAYSAKELASIKSKIKSAAKKVGIEISEDEKSEKIAKALGIESPDLLKDMYAIGDAAMVISTLDRLAAYLATEQAAEGDDSDIAAGMAEIRDELGDLLIEMAQEEIKEIAEGKDWRSASQQSLGYGPYGW